MIPSLISPGNPAPFKVLPAGVHAATLSEVEATYAYTPHRRRLFRGFCAAVAELQAAGCQTIYLDGSFVTDKRHPNDFDACWDPAGVDISKLHPTLLDFSNSRAAQKTRYLGELFIATHVEARSRLRFVDYFQVDRYSNCAKGIIYLDLSAALS